MRALGTLVWTEAKLLGRDTLSVVFAFTVPLVALYLLASIFGNVPDPGGGVFGGVGPLDFYVPVYLVVTVAALGFIVLPAHLIGYRQRGVLRRFRTSMAPGWAIVVSQVLAPVGIAFSAALLLAGAASLFGQATPPGRAWPSLLAFLFVAATFVVVGMMLGSVLTTRAVGPIGILLWFSSLLLAGGGLPPDVLPGAIRSAGQASPVYWAVRLVQEPWWGHPWHWGAFASTAGLLVVAALVAWRLFRWE